MSKKTRKLTLSALFAALSVASLYIASVWPTGQYGIVAFASLFVAAAVIDIGPAYGFYVFIVSSALGMLILPNKAAPLLFILFFGYYPVVKSIVEKIGNRVVQWFLKLAVFNAALSVIYLFLKDMLLGFSERIPGVFTIYLLGSAVFALYDYGFSNALRLYKERISKQTGIRG